MALSAINITMDLLAMKSRAYPDAIIVYDGTCRLCNGWVNFVLANDRDAYFSFCAAQSETGAEILAELGIIGTGQPLLDYESILLVKKWGRNKSSIAQKSTAALEIFKRLKRPYSFVYAFRLIPEFLRDVIYDFVARNRYRWFGHYSVCQVPSQDVADRFIS